MGDQDGPKVDIPEELVAAIEASSEESAASPEEPAADGEAAPAATDAAVGSDETGDPDVTAAYAELNDKYLRLAAEFDNFRRRTLKERQDLLNYGTENLIKELLATVDNLERALGHAGEAKEALDSKKLSEGVELTYRSLLQILEKSGVAAVETEGKIFDPAVHEALRKVPTSEQEPGTILEIYQKGYLLKDRLLRPALVAVAGAAQGESE